MSATNPPFTSCVAARVRNGSTWYASRVGRTWSAISSFALLLAACGGRSHGAADDDAPTGGVGSGGSASQPPPATGGTTFASDCDHVEGDYVARTPEACASAGLTCGPGTAVFADACGCGCDSAPFDDSWGTFFEQESPEECGGPSGPFATLQATPERLVIGTDAVFVWVTRPVLRGTTDVWAIDKRTGAVSLVPDGAPMPESAPGSIVSETDTIEREGVGWYVTHDGIVVEETSAGFQSLFRLPVAAAFYAIIVIDSEVYVTTTKGALFRGVAGSPDQNAVLVEQRGNMDADDYALILGADADAIYWLAGPFSDARIQDRDPLTLYRTCR
jgi:hypothetical protein